MTQRAPHPLARFSSVIRRSVVPIALLLLAACGSSEPEDEAIEQHVTLGLMGNVDEQLTQNFLLAPFGLKAEMRNLRILGKKTTENECRVRYTMEMRLFATKMEKEWKAIADGMAALAALAAVFDEKVGFKDAAAIKAIFGGDWVTFREEIRYTRWDDGWMIED
jgi:hypothetical protein